MSNLTFSNLVSEVFAHLGLDSTDTTNQTNVYRWINYVQQDICSRWPWPFLLAREAIATIPDYTTGTASTTNGSASVTGTSTVWTTTQGAPRVRIAGLPVIRATDPDSCGHPRVGGSTTTRVGGGAAGGPNDWDSGEWEDAEWQ